MDPTVDMYLPLDVLTSSAFWYEPGPSTLLPIAFLWRNLGWLERTALYDRGDVAICVAMLANRITSVL